ncbi:MAG: hypothetical protein M1814_001297 [Vezdaea aestivalis]|nr:MAG: hypothetical protein M1814_001297 [Vezdaea aestivalis]
MARAKLAAGLANPFAIHDDVGAREDQDEYEERTTDREEDSESALPDETDDEPDDEVFEDIQKFNATFKGISERYRLINRIGEGTFSTVYKAEDLLYDQFDNDWDIEQKENLKWSTPPLKKRRRGDHLAESSNQEEAQRKRGPQFVAIKKIYVTSSPMRIQNELELLYDLRGCDSVCPLITAFRHQDQVVAILPYFRHVDFREYFRDFTVPDMRLYFRSLFTALASVHRHEILHRDIKPTNFLYDIERRRGVLVDFGLAEVSAILASGRTRNEIDVWSAGVILLTILARRFPFFNSTDDIEAMIEVSTIFGIRKMKSCAMLHGSNFETSIPTVSEKGYSLEKIILWSTCRTGNKDEAEDQGLSSEERQAATFLKRLLDLDPNKRASAEEALADPFLAAAGEGHADEDEMALV